MTDLQLDDQGRPEPPQQADELSTLTGFLDFQRATLEWKTRGLTSEQLRTRLSAHPSGMTLAGLLKHLAYVEDYWFTEVICGEPMPAPWDAVDWQADEDWEWHSAQAQDARALRDLWETSLARSRAVARDVQLERRYPAWGGQAEVSGRWVLTHMIEEYARHNGHADLLRELVDGETGE